MSLRFRPPVQPLSPSQALQAAASYWGGRQSTLPPYCSSACDQHLQDRRCFRAPSLISLDDGEGKQRSTGDEQGYCRKGEGKKKKEKTGFKRYRQGIETEGGKKKQTYRRNAKVSSHVHSELHLIGLPVLPDMKGETAAQHCQATASSRYSINFAHLNVFKILFRQHEHEQGS